MKSKDRATVVVQEVCNDFFEQLSANMDDDDIEVLNQLIEHEHELGRRSVLEHPPQIKITIEGGVLQEVEGLPEGWSYELNDLDDQGA